MVRPSMGRFAAVTELTDELNVWTNRLLAPAAPLPIQMAYCCAPAPGVHWNVGDEDASVERLAGLVMTPGNPDAAVKVYSLYCQDPSRSDQRRTYTVRPSVGRPPAVTDVAVVLCTKRLLAPAPPEPIQMANCDAEP